MGNTKLNPDDFNDYAIRNLAYSVCMQAASDYKKSINNLLRKQPNQEGIENPEVYEAFFRSDWFKMLSGFENSEHIIEHLRKNKDTITNIFDYKG